MYGAIIGDIAGSRFEFNNIKTKSFELFDTGCNFTDDTVMTCAIAAALCSYKNVPDCDLSEAATFWMQKLGKKYKYAGYGRGFFKWINSPNPLPYNSFGNGAAMRVSPCGLAARSIDEAFAFAESVTKVSHNHEEGIKGAKVISGAVYLAKEGHSKEDIQSYAEKFYDLNFTIDEIRPFYTFNETCQGSVPQAIKCFLESEDFEDCIKIAISLGGDSDTIAAIAGSIAEPYYGTESTLIDKANNYLDSYLLKIIKTFESCYL